MPWRQQNPTHEEKNRNAKGRHESNDLIYMLQCTILAVSLDSLDGIMMLMPQLCCLIAFVTELISRRWTGATTTYHDRLNKSSFMVLGCSCQLIIFAYPLLQQQNVVDCVEWGTSMS